MGGRGACYKRDSKQKQQKEKREQSKEIVKEQSEVDNTQPEQNKSHPLKINIQLFAYKALKLQKKEYGKIIREIDDLYASKYKNQKVIFHYSGNYTYKAIVHNFNNYTIISKRRIK